MRQRITTEQTRIPSGTAVNVRLDDGTIWPTKTRSLPWMLDHGAWVVMIEGRAGSYDLERVTVRDVDSEV
jgi:hypothetical protein